MSCFILVRSLVPINKDVRLGKLLNIERSRPVRLLLTRIISFNVGSPASGLKFGHSMIRKRLLGTRSFFNRKLEDKFKLISFCPSMVNSSSEVKFEKSNNHGELNVN